MRRREAKQIPGSAAKVNAGRGDMLDCSNPAKRTSQRVFLLDKVLGVVCVHKSRLVVAQFIHGALPPFILLVLRRVTSCLLFSFSSAPHPKCLSRFDVLANSEPLLVLRTPAYLLGLFVGRQSRPERVAPPSSRFQAALLATIYSRPFLCLPSQCIIPTSHHLRGNMPARS